MHALLLAYLLRKYVKFVLQQSGLAFFVRGFELRIFYLRGMFMSKAFGEHLRSMRTDKTNYSQVEMAKMLNISRSTYTYYETGKSEPNFANLRKMATILGVDYNEIFDYEE